MLSAILISAILLFIGVLLLGLRIFFTKDGKFPNIHIGGNKALRDKGISCVSTQDKLARKNTKRMTISDMMNEISENH